MASDTRQPPLDLDPTAPLTDSEIANLRPAAEVFAELGMPVPKMGRPRAAAPKVPVTMRLDPDVLAYFKAGGAGWQTRMGNVLAKEARKPRR